jgi:hypothetical protein
MRLVQQTRAQTRTHNLHESAFCFHGSQTHFPSNSFYISDRYKVARNDRPEEWEIVFRPAMVTRFSYPTPKPNSPILTRKVTQLRYTPEDQPLNTRVLNPNLNPICQLEDPDHHLPHEIRTRQ